MLGTRKWSLYLISEFQISRDTAIGSWHKRSSNNKKPRPYWVVGFTHLWGFNKNALPHLNLPQPGTNQRHTLCRYYWNNMSLDIHKSDLQLAVELPNPLGYPIRSRVDSLTWAARFYSCLSVSGSTASMQNGARSGPQNHLTVKRGTKALHTRWGSKSVLFILHSKKVLGSQWGSSKPVRCFYLEGQSFHSRIVSMVRNHLKMPSTF